MMEKDVREEQNETELLERVNPAAVNTFPEGSLRPIPQISQHSETQTNY